MKDFFILNLKLNLNSVLQSEKKTDKLARNQKAWIALSIAKSNDVETFSKILKSTSKILYDLFDYLNKVNDSIDYVFYTISML